MLSGANHPSGQRLQCACHPSPTAYQPRLPLPDTQQTLSAGVWAASENPGSICFNINSNYLLPLLELSPGTGHPTAEWSSAVQEGRCLSSGSPPRGKRGKTARGSQWDALIFPRLTHLQEKSHGVWLDHDGGCPRTGQQRKGTHTANSGKGGGTFYV